MRLSVWWLLAALIHNFQWKLAQFKSVVSNPSFNTTAATADLGLEKIRRLQSTTALEMPPPPVDTTKALLDWLKQVETAINTKRRHFAELYQISESRLSEVEFYDKSQKERDIVKRLLRAMVLGDSFVVVVGGMSDTAGHGNLFNDSYPLVMRKTIHDVMTLANIKFDVRNMAMGGVPSYPSSMCMKDVWGADADVIVWDFRMVEHDSLKGELYIRQVSRPSTIHYFFWYGIPPAFGLNILGFASPKETFCSIQACQWLPWGFQTLPRTSITTFH